MAKNYPANQRFFELRFGELSRGDPKHKQRQDIFPPLCFLSSIHTYSQKSTLRFCHNQQNLKVLF